MIEYDEDYFLHGKQTGKSLYENYHWMPELTIPMVKAIVAHLRLKTTDRILDFGCARGYVVKALRQLGYNAFGVDLSEWAVMNADEDTKKFINWTYNSPPLTENEFDWVIAKDVLEHVEDVYAQVDLLMREVNNIFVVVPLSNIDGLPYAVPQYEEDVTHRHRLSLSTWATMFMRPGWSVEARYRLPGVKDNYAQWETGNGFITARGL